MKASIAGELVLLAGLLALGWLLYVQQEQLVQIELELDRVKGALAPAEKKPRPRAKPTPKAEA